MIGTIYPKSPWQAVCDCATKRAALYDSLTPGLMYSGFSRMTYAELLRRDGDAQGEESS